MYLYPPYQIPRYNMLMIEYILINIYFCEIENKKKNKNLIMGYDYGHIVDLVTIFYN